MKLLIKAAIAAAFIGGKVAFVAPTQSCLPDDVLYVGLNFPTGVPDSACCSGKSAGSYCVSGDKFSGPAIKVVGPPAFVIPQQPIPTPEKESTPTPSSNPPPPAPVPSTSATCGETCQTPLPVPLLSPPDSAHPSNLLPEPTSPGPVYTPILAGKGAEALDPTMHVPIPVEESSVVSITTHVPIPVQDSSASQIVSVFVSVSTTHVPVPVDESPVVSITTHVPIPVQESSTFHLTTRVPIPVKGSWTGPVWSLSLWPTPRIPIPVAEGRPFTLHGGPSVRSTKAMEARDETSTYTFPVSLPPAFLASPYKKLRFLSQTPRVPIPVAEGRPFTLHGGPSVRSTQTVEARDEEPTSANTFPTPRVPIPVSEGSHIGPGWSHTLHGGPTDFPTTTSTSTMTSSEPHHFGPGWSHTLHSGPT
ncbi:MAG: hypothetical protein Q9228_005538 [Teloschistes exilis]